LHLANMPVEFVPNIVYRRAIDDATGVGDLAVHVPARRSPLQTFATALGYAPAPGALNAAFWHDSRRSKTVLHFHDEPFRQGNAIGRVYTKPGSTWDALFDGGGLGPCDPHPQTGYHCVIAPGLNLRYDEGTEGRLLLVR
jgi:hypothetical protein